MRKFFADAYREYKAIKKNRVYRVFRYGFYVVFTAYFLTIVFPQYLFAHSAAHKNLKVYARQPLDENMTRVLEAAEARLSSSPIYDRGATQRIFISDSFAFYAFLSPVQRQAFANTIPGVGHIRVNRADAARDLVFRDAPADNQRSLSGVIAHEVTHNMVRRKFGLVNSFTSLPNWKDEGYCEYVAGGTTLSYEEGVRRWRASPAGDDARLAYFKYHQMVKYLLEVEKISVEELFGRDFDERELEKRVFEHIQNGKS